jgi:hypothetical protein
MRQTDNSNLKQRYQEQIRHIKQNDPQSPYALRIVNNNHEYGLINITMTLLQQITQTPVLIPHEQFFIQSLYCHQELIREQNTGENNPMYQLIFNPHIRSPTTIHTDQYSNTTTS